MHGEINRTNIHGLERRVPSSVPSRQRTPVASIPSSEIVRQQEIHYTPDIPPVASTVLIEFHLADTWSFLRPHPLVDDFITSYLNETPE